MINKEQNTIKYTDKRLSCSKTIYPIYSEAHEVTFIKEVKREIEKEEIKSAVLGMALAFLVCAFFIACWIIFGY